MRSKMVKQNYSSDTSPLVPLGASQATVVDSAFTVPTTFVDHTWWFHAMQDPAVPSWGVLECVVFRLGPGAGAIPNPLTDAFLDGLDEDAWMKFSVPYGQGSISSIPTRSRSKRTFKVGERLCIVYKWNHFGAGPALVTGSLRALWIQIRE